MTTPVDRKHGKKTFREVASLSAEQQAISVSSENVKKPFWRTHILITYPVPSAQPKTCGCKSNSQWAWCVCVWMDECIIMTMKEEVMNSREMEPMLQELELESREKWMEIMYLQCTHRKFSNTNFKLKILEPIQCLQEGKWIMMWSLNIHEQIK